MPTHVVLICLVMNAAIGAILALGGLLMIQDDGLTGGALFCLLVAGVCGYTAYVINKIRLYLKAQTIIPGAAEGGRPRAESVQDDDSR
jgi:hypothetical protein